ncbi:MAG: NAD(P)-binding domain-containing protein [Crocinitomicaceae bacterium]|nr:NAD(P)-binding domain-containing protein [Crocinitomicaceae bacterium]
MKKKIGIIGSGVVAKILGTGFLKHGYDVMLGSRDLSKLDEWKSANAGAKTGSFSDAANFGEIVVLAVSGRHASSALKLIGADNLNGKTIIDTTNPISEEAPENGVLRFFTNLDQSLMEILQKEVPGADFVKAFNSVGSAYMVDPKFEITPSMFICGNNADAKKDVRSILEDFGWEVEDMGMAESARSIEPLCMLWCIPGFLEGRWSHAFKLLKA